MLWQAHIHIVQKLLSDTSIGLIYSDDKKIVQIIVF